MFLFFDRESLVRLNATIHPCYYNENNQLICDCQTTLAIPNDNFLNINLIESVISHEDKDIFVLIPDKLQMTFDEFPQLKNVAIAIPKNIEPYRCNIHLCPELFVPCLDLNFAKYFARDPDGNFKNTFSKERAEVLSQRIYYIIDPNYCKKNNMSLQVNTKYDYVNETSRTFLTYALASFADKEDPNKSHIILSSCNNNAYKIIGDPIKIEKNNMIDLFLVDNSFIRIMLMADSVNTGLGPLSPRG